jgi:hypothetical protein
VASEDLGGDVVRSSDSRVGHQSSGSSPVVDLGSVADRKVNLINSNRVAVARLVRSSLKELLVIVVVMKSVETC